MMDALALDAASLEFILLVHQAYGLGVLISPGVWGTTRRGFFLRTA